MKKFLIIAVAAVCCLAFTMPAMAKVTIGGNVEWAAYYIDRSSEIIAGGVRQGTVNIDDDLGRTHMDLYQPWNRLWTKYVSDDGNIGGYIQIRGGGDGGATASAFSWYYGWIDWHFNPNFYLRIGRQTQTFAIFTPPIGVGATNVPALFFGYGNIHGGSSRDAIRAYIKFNDMVRMEIQALNPDNDAAGEVVIPGAPGTTNAARALEENTIPRFDISLPIKVANFNIEPSFTWLRQEFDQVAAGNDDDFDIWGLALGIKTGFGPILFQGEVTYGENLGSANYVGGAPGKGIPGPTGVARAYVDANGNTKIEDTEILAWWAALGVKFGPSTLWGVVGMQKMENDGSPAPLLTDATEFDITRWAYGARLDVKVAKGFNVIPEIVWYDGDSSADVGGAAGSVDYGDELMIGCRFLLSF